MVRERDLSFGNIQRHMETAQAFRNFFLEHGVGLVVAVAFA